MEHLIKFLTIYILAYIVSIPGLWQTFKKLDINPWWSPWPFVNDVVLMRHYNFSIWLISLFFFPPLSLPILVLLNYKLSKSFDQNVGFTIGLSFWFTYPIFISLIGFGRYEFIGKEGLV